MKNVMLALGATLIAFVFAEGMTRFVRSPSEWTPSGHPGENSKEQCKGTEAPYEKKGQCYAVNPHLAMMEYSVSMGHVSAPNHTGHRFHTNNARMRYDVDLYTTKPVGERRIFITGGSAAWGAGVDQESSVAAALERELRRLTGDEKIRVINAGVSAFTSVQELMFTLHYITPLQPDLVIAYSGWNDLYAGYTGASYFDNPDFMRIVDMVINTPLINPWHQAHLRHRRSSDNRASPPQWGEYSVKIAYLLAKGFYALQNPPHVVREKLNKTMVPLDTIAERILRVNAAMAAMAMQDRYRFMYALQPSLYTVKKPPTPFEKKMRGNYHHKYALLEERFVEGYRRLVADVAIHADKWRYQFIDTSTAFANEKRVVFADHVHLGDRGCRVIAEFLAPVVLKALEYEPPASDDK